MPLDGVGRKTAKFDGSCTAPGRKRKILTGSKRELFMKVLTETAVVRTACAAVGISYTTAYLIRKKDEQFAKD